MGVEKIGDDTYKVRVHAAPDKGAANKEVIVSLADYFNVSPSMVKIVRGEKSRTKLIELSSRA